MWHKDVCHSKGCRRLECV